MFKIRNGCGDLSQMWLWCRLSGPGKPYSLLGLDMKFFNFYLIGHARPNTDLKHFDELDLNFARKFKF